MNFNSDHPSFLELDRAFLRAPTSDRTLIHLASCPICQAHNGRLGEELEVPTWVREIEPVALPRSRSRPFLQSRWMWSAAALILFSAGLLAALWLANRREDRSTQSKGTPTAGIYIKRGEKTFLWDGGLPVVPGDRLRLKVVPEGFSHLTVFAQGRGDPGTSAPTRLYQDRLPDTREFLLPVAWQVDDAPGPEVLLLVFCQQASGCAAAPITLHNQLGSERWILRFDLPKQTGPSRGDQR